MTRLTRVLCSIGLTIAMFMGTLDTTIVNIAIPKIMDDLHGSLANTSWVMTIYTLAMSVFMITTSKIADRYGRKKIMLLGLALFGGFSAACTTANSLPMLITFRFFQGLGGAIITPIVLPMGIEVFGKEKTQSGGRPCWCRDRVSSSRWSANWWDDSASYFMALDFWH